MFYNQLTVTGFWKSRIVPAQHLSMNGREEETSKNLSWCRTYCCTSWSTDFLSQRLGSGMTFDLPGQSETPQRDWVLLSPNPSISVFLYSSYKWTNILFIMNSLEHSESVNCERHPTEPEHQLKCGYNLKKIDLALSHVTQLKLLNSESWGLW